MSPAPPSMGPHLRGWTPPFTPSGTASYWNLGVDSFQGIIGAHWGILARFRAERGGLERLLPAPLEPSETTDLVSFFVNETVALVEGATDLSAIEPAEARFREALLVIPCRHQGVDYTYHFVMYTDSDWNVYVANMIGLWTKFASINMLLPLPPNPRYGTIADGALLKASVSRFDERIITSSFRAREEVDPTGISDFAVPILGMRYFPDISIEAQGRPLIHDLVINDIVDITIEQAWVGEATVTFGASPREELRVFEPLEMLESHFVSGFHYRHRGARVLHDYLAT